MDKFYICEMDKFYVCKDCNSVFVTPETRHMIFYDENSSVQFSDVSVLVCPYCDSSNVVEEKKK